MKEQAQNIAKKDYGNYVKNNNSSIHDEQDKIQCPYCNKYIISKKEKIL